MEDEFKNSSLIRVGDGLHDHLWILDPETEAPTLEKIKDELIKFGLTARLDQEGILDQLLEKEKETGISVKLLVDPESEKLAEMLNARYTRFLPESIKPVPHFLLIDNNEVIFFPSKEDAPRKKMSSIWTNYDAFTRVLTIMFIKLWTNSEHT